MAGHLEDVDVTSSAFKADPFPFYARLRAEAPVHPVTIRRRQRAWLVTRYADVVTVLKDHETFVKDPLRAMSPEQLRRAPRIPGCSPGSSATCSASTEETTRG